MAAEVSWRGFQGSIWISAAEGGIMQKRLDLLTIFLLSSLMISFMPAMASNDTLEIFGNANMDGAIDEKDIAYVEGVIKGTNAATNLSDANYDGKIDAQDIEQIGQIMRGEEKKITIIDEIGRAVTMPGNPKRIISLTGYPAETICALGEGDRIVGLVNPQNQFLPVLLQKDSIGESSVTPNLEKILELKPDVVIAYQWTSTQSLDDLEKSGISVLCFRAWDIYEELKLIRKMGVVLHKEARSKEFSDFIESKINMIEDKTKDLKPEEKPQVFYEVFTPYKTAAIGTALVAEGYGRWGGIYKAASPEQILVDLAGGINCVGQQPTGYPTMDPEWVVDTNPDIFFKTPKEAEVGGTPSAEAMMKVRDEIMERPELKNTTCVKDGKVFVTHSKIVAGPRQIIGLCYLAKWFHPELFPELDPRSVHEEMLKRFWGLGLEGKWGYPENETVLA
jgi:iron complex transport system substrate-binding protein